MYKQIEKFQNLRLPLDIIARDLDIPETLLAEILAGREESEDIIESIEQWLHLASPITLTKTFQEIHTAIVERISRKMIYIILPYEQYYQNVITAIFEHNSDQEYRLYAKNGPYDGIILVNQTSQITLAELFTLQAQSTAIVLFGSNPLKALADMQCTDDKSLFILPDHRAEDINTIVNSAWRAEDVKTRRYLISKVANNIDLTLEIIRELHGKKITTEKIRQAEANIYRRKYDQISSFC
jgi:hypothetical protein